MPNCDPEKRPEDDLDLVARVMETVHRQVGSYMTSLQQLRTVRREIEVNPNLRKRVTSGSREMVKVLVERGVPEPLAAGMSAEDWRDLDLAGSLGLWTWDCCCTGCCLTCICTQNTSAVANPGESVINPQIGR